VCQYSLTLKLLYMCDFCTCQDVARGLQELLSYEGDVEEDFGLTFQAGSIKLLELLI
jgi:hypothetical protein